MNTPLIVPSRPAVIRAKRCENCGCATASSLDPSGKLLECHANPATAPYAPMQLPGGAGVQFAAGPGVFPLMPVDAPSSFCVNGWKPKVEGLN
jgi:hypothetical protein